MNDKPNEPDPPQNDDTEQPLPASVKNKLAFLLSEIAYSGGDEYAIPDFVYLYRRHLAYLIRRSQRGQKTSGETSNEKATDEPGR